MLLASLVALGLLPEMAAAQVGRLLGEKEWDQERVIDMFDLPEVERLAIVLALEEFDPMLGLIAPGGDVYFNDDTHGLNAALALENPQPGRWSLVVLAYHQPAGAGSVRRLLLSQEVRCGGAGDRGGCEAGGIGPALAEPFRHKRHSLRSCRQRSVRCEEIR